MQKGAWGRPCRGSGLFWLFAPTDRTWQPHLLLSLKLSERHSLCWIDEGMVTRQAVRDRSKRVYIASPCSATDNASTKALCQCCMRISLQVLMHSDVCVKASAAFHMHAMQIILLPTYDTAIPQ